MYLCGSVTELSKAAEGIVAAGESDCGDWPASTLQEATPVAPFQLAFTIVSSPVSLALARIAGGTAGRALHGKRKAR